MYARNTCQNVQSIYFFLCNPDKYWVIACGKPVFILFYLVIRSLSINCTANKKKDLKKIILTF